ncbi:MAG TPA: preprotein translocase subunit SecE, partial [Actinophytocola sp.]|uniref:preprotein translocase subunit SecE n=1 Tax=Actinophytocola sp. TaxID=1872138 RepID=UPI002DDCB21A
MSVVREKEKEPRENVIIRTFREVRSEMRKVVWPTREETIRLTIVVIAISAVISVLLFVADTIFATLLALLQSAV